MKNNLIRVFISILILAALISAYKYFDDKNALEYEYNKIIRVEFSEFSEGRIHHTALRFKEKTVDELSFSTSFYKTEQNDLVVILYLNSEFLINPNSFNIICADKNVNLYKFKDYITEMMTIHRPDPESIKQGIFEEFGESPLNDIRYTVAYLEKHTTFSRYREGATNWFLLEKSRFMNENNAKGIEFTINNKTYKYLFSDDELTLFNNLKGI